MELAPSSSSTTAAACLFSVRDTGIGIPREKAALIFDPFQQADGSISRQYGGSGLGLAICAKLVKLMDGTIWVESEEGKGSAFFFTANFPLPTDEQQAVTAKQRTSHDMQWQGRVLVADDNAVNRMVITRLLEKQGVAVVTAADGEEAIQRLRHELVDLVFMDVQMPLLDGIAASKRIREGEQAGNTRVPIVALTAHAMPEDRQRCLAAGMDGYLAKPIQVQELQAVLSTYLPVVEATPAAVLTHA